MKARRKKKRKKKQETFVDRKIRTQYEENKNGMSDLQHIGYITITIITIDFRCGIMKELDLKQIKVDISEVSSTIVETTEQKCRALICFGWQKRFILHFFINSVEKTTTSGSHFWWSKFNYFQEFYKFQEETTTFYCFIAVNIWKML